MTRTSRRRFLHALGVSGALGLAGCSGDGGGGDDTDSGGTDGSGGTDDTDGTDGSDDTSSDDGTGGDATVITVGPGGSLTFDPASVEVATGETVRWEWDSDFHTVTPESMPDGADWAGEPDTHNSGHTYEHSFSVAGTYEYYCQPHRGQGMEGSVTVTDG